MTVPAWIYLLAAAGAFLTVVGSMPLWKKWCVRAGLVDDPGHRKLHEGTVPLAGGLAVMTGLMVPTAIAALLLWWQTSAQPAAPPPQPHPDTALASPLNANTAALLEHGFQKRYVELAAILGGAIGMLLVGIVDDKHELRARTKFAGQALVAGLVAASGVRITLFVPSPWFHYTVTILWILTLINAFNFMDNMNGLCAGLGAIGACYFGALAAMEGQYLVASIAFLTFGSLLGFLPYNFPRGRVFLGDSGSHLVGYLLAVLAILPHFYTPHHARPLAVLMPLCVLAVPLLDLVWVVLLRWRLGKPFYVGDTNHLSHRLVRAGLTRAQAVVVIWFLAALSGAIVFWR
jgi:UDP-GlcNAc:undecaprenyl-phosphate GlcNAc-1-phosphate transferase